MNEPIDWDNRVGSARKGREGKGKERKGKERDGIRNEGWKGGEKVYALFFVVFSIFVEVGLIGFFWLVCLGGRQPDGTK